MRNLSFMLVILLALLCAACASNTASLPSIRPYHMDIQQGNVVTPKMIMQLKPGMTKSQVRFVMGTPLLTDSFHADRWDYFYSLKKDGYLIEQRRVILEFEKDALKRVRGDVIPAGSAGAASGQEKTTIPPTSIWENKPDAPKEEKKGLLDKLKFWDGDKKPEQKPQPTPAPEAKPEVQPAPADIAPPEPKPVVQEKQAQEKPVEKPAEKMQDEPASAPQEEKKGLLDKLKFWGDDKKSAPMPEPVVEQKPELKPEPVPAKPAVEEKSADAPQQKEKGLLDKLKFWGDDKETPKPEATPEPIVKPVPKPVPKMVPKPKPKPVSKPAPAAEPVEPKAAPQPADLPPEEDPTYFERMLEKIGF